MLNLSAQSSFKKNTSMRDNGRIMRETEEAFSSGGTALFTKDTGKIMLHTVMGDLFMQMETSMLGNGLMIEPLEKVKIC